MRIFFEPVRENGHYLLKLKDNEETEKYYGDRNLLLEDLINKYTRGRERIFNSSDQLKNEADETQAAAIALSLLWTGHAWESAGRGEMTSFSSPIVNFFMFPNERAKNKIINKKEIWGGDRLGAWLVNASLRASEGNRSYQKFIDDWKSDKVHPFPKRMFYSIWEEMEVLTEGGETMSAAQAFYEAKKIDFSRSGDGLATNYYMTDYLDYAGNAIKLYETATGANLLKVDETGQWIFSLNRQILKGREKSLIQPYLDKEYVQWAIAAAFESGLWSLRDATALLKYIRPAPTMDVFFDVLMRVMDERVLDKKEKKEIIRAYMADNLVARQVKILLG